MNFKRLLGNGFAVLLVLSMVLSLAAPAAAAGPTPPGKSPDLSSVKVDPNEAGVNIARLKNPQRTLGGGEKPGVASLAALGDTVVNVMVDLNQPSLASKMETLTEAQRAAYADEVKALQDAVAKEIEKAGGTIFYRFRTLSSGLVVTMPGRIATEIGKIPAVTRLARIQDYEKDLSETVPFVGADAVKAAGYTGKGIKVAVLDSGIDYTHKSFGGPGTRAAWEAAYYGNALCVNELGRLDNCANSQQPDATLFGPNAPRVKGGYDWVGPLWPSYGGLMPDPNPIANQGDTVTGDNGTHGTHVADIIGGGGYPAGTNEDGPYPAKGEGMAPGVDLYAFTVCSGVSTSCSGAAILAGLDDAADLDDNPSSYDPADVINLSLGAPYGQPESDDVYLVNELTLYGSVVVISAGNSGDKPFVVGSPSMAKGSISVAQTSLPSDTAYVIDLGGPAGIAPAAPVWQPVLTVLQPWSPTPTADITGPLTYDSTNATQCAPSAAGKYAGKVLLINRGTCSISIKVANAAIGGAIAAVVTNNQPQGKYDLPLSFSYGGGDVTIPGFTVNTNDGFGSSSPLRALAAAGTTIIIPAQAESLAYSMASTSSRGPRNHDNLLKPDIGAPGASTSAVAGTGTQSEVFGGTSGAAPMVSGGVALMKEVMRKNLPIPPFMPPSLITDPLLPQQYKALLMNTANNMIYKNPIAGYLAAVSRIGAGQMDVEKALKTPLLAWDVTSSDELDWTGSLSFGYTPMPGPMVLNRVVRVKNLSYRDQTVSVSSSFRFADDMNKGITVSASPDFFVVDAGATQDVMVTLTYNPTAPGATPPTWPDAFNRGSSGYDGYQLDLAEVDGYLYFDATVGPSLTGSISMPWHTLPKAVALNGAAPTAPGMITVNNGSSFVTGKTDTFALVDSANDGDGVGGAIDYGYMVGTCNIFPYEGCSESPVDLKEVGVRGYKSGATDMVSFGLTLWDFPYRAGQYPMEFDIYVDFNRDGVDDYVLFNADGNAGNDGRNVLFLADLHTGFVYNLGGLGYFAQSDFDSNKFIFTVPAGYLEIDPNQPFDFYVLTFDAWFTGNLWDYSPAAALYHTYTLNRPRFELTDAVNDTTFTVAKTGSTTVEYDLNTYDPAASGSQVGFLFLYDSALPMIESTAVVLNPIQSSFFYPPVPTFGSSEYLVDPGQAVMVDLTVENMNYTGMSANIKSDAVVEVYPEVSLNGMVIEWWDATSGSLVKVGEKTISDAVDEYGGYYTFFLSDFIGGSRAQMNLDSAKTYHWVFKFTPTAGGANNMVNTTTELWVRGVAADTVLYPTAFDLSAMDTSEYYLVGPWANTSVTVNPYKYFLPSLVQ